VATELSPRRIVAAKRSPERERDHDVARARAEAQLDDQPAPAELDLRRAWHAVGDQGRTAACVGWAVADSALRWQLVNAGRLDETQRLSPRHVWMAAKESDARTAYPSAFLEEDGTSLKAGLDVVRRFGAVLEQELPWSGVLATGSPDSFNQSATGRRVSRYFNLGDDREPDRSVFFDAWRRWMAQHGPVVVLLQVDRHLGDPGPVLRDFDPVDPPASHAAALFGYGPDHFLLRSSWGESWGDAGYARMDLDYTARAVIESYGIVI
jgi:Papain family cysteine protease